MIVAPPREDIDLRPVDDELAPAKGVSEEPRKKTLNLGGGHMTPQAWAMQRLYNAPPPVALAPLRWNLDKIKRSFEDKVAWREEAAKVAEAQLDVRQTREVREMKRQLGKKMAKAQEGVPLSGQLKKLSASVANLQRLGRKEEAAEVAKRLPRLEKKFWEEKLGGEGGYFEQERRKV